MFKKLLAAIGKNLKSKNIPYMVIGGQAVLLYGEPRMTKDIDITLGIGIDQLLDILDIIQNIPLKVLPDDINSFVKRTMVLPALHEKTGIRVDFIFSFSLYEKEAIIKTKKVLLNNVNVNFASPEDVIIHKILAHRARDIEDVRSILLKNIDINKKYITKWLKEFEKTFPEINFIEMFNKILSDI